MAIFKRSIRFIARGGAVGAFGRRLFKGRSERKKRVVRRGRTVSREPQTIVSRRRPTVASRRRPTVARKMSPTTTSTRKIRKPFLSVSTKKTAILPEIRKISKLKLGVKKVITDLRNKTMSLIEKKSGFFSGISGGITFGKDQLKQYLPFVIIGAIVIVVGVGVGRMLAKGKGR